MSVLRDRIISQPGIGGPEYAHPGGTSATPMVMPLAHVDYAGMSAYYQDMHSMPATAEPNSVPLAVLAPGSFGKVVPAGRA